MRNEDNRAVKTFDGSIESLDKLLTNGGRVLGATAVDTTLKSAIDGAYALVSQIKFDNAFYRHDIGAKAMKAMEE